jgi:CheY-like chemotaxis protein
VLTRVLAILLALFGATAAASSALSAWSLSRTLTEQYESKGKAIADTIAEASVDILINRDPATLQAKVDEYLETEGVAYIFVTDSEGETVAHTFAPGIPPELDDLEDSAGGAEEDQVRRVTIAGLAGEAGRRPGEGEPSRAGPQTYLDVSAPMMLSSSDRQEGAARCRGLGLAGYLTKPVTPSELRSALVSALTEARRRGRVPWPGRNARPGPLPDGPLKPACLRVLLAEDNPVNQRLALRLLEKQGHSVRVAGTGREVLEALGAAGRFDLLLLDIQLPDLDGFEVAAQVRGRERGTGRHLPIVALTAQALKGDCERCLEAGMDGYLTKPIQAAALREVLAPLAPLDPAAAAEG